MPGAYDIDDDGRRLCGVAEQMQMATRDRSNFREL